MLGSTLRRRTALTPVLSSFDWHDFVDRSALFTNRFRRHREIVSAKHKRSAASLNLPEAFFMCAPFGSPLILFTVEGPRCPIAGGLLDFKRYGAMRRNAPSPFAHKHKTAFGTSLSTSESNRRTAQPARRPEGQASREIFCGHTALLVCARALFFA